LKGEGKVIEKKFRDHYFGFHLKNPCTTQDCNHCLFIQQKQTKKLSAELISNLIWQIEQRIIHQILSIAIENLLNELALFCLEKLKKSTKSTFPTQIQLLFKEYLDELHSSDNYKGILLHMVTFVDSRKETVNQVENESSRGYCISFSLLTKNFLGRMLAKSLTCPISKGQDNERSSTSTTSNQIKNQVMIIYTLLKQITQKEGSTKALLQPITSISCSSSQDELVNQSSKTSTSKPAISSRRKKQQVS
jgi:hypothetical protein